MAAYDGEFFEVSRKMFTDINEFNKLSDQVLSRNFFMMNRSIAIKFPDKAQAFNILGINEPDVMKFWSTYIGNTGRVPGFMFTKGSKASQKEKEIKMKMPSKKLIKEFCLHYNLNRKDVMSAIKLYNNEMINEIFEYEKMINQINKD